jgi:hypothetical protein
MYRRWFESVLLPDAREALNPDSRLEPPPEIDIDVIRRDIAHRSYCAKVAFTGSVSKQCGEAFRYWKYWPRMAEIRLFPTPPLP